MRTRAILLVFQSESPITENFLAELGQMMAKRLGISGDIDTNVFTPEEITNILVTNAKKTSTSKINFDENKLNAAENAIILIGTIMRENLVNYFGRASFKAALADKVQDLLCYGTVESYQNFIKAMKELSRDTVEVSASIMRKYHFSREKILVIKQYYDELFGV